MQKPAYLDNNATTPLDPRVFETMLPFFVENFGNAMSAQHSYGWTAKAAIEKAREQCARLIHAEPREIIFTSGATESIHLALLGALETFSGENKSTPARLITTAVEHKCVLEVAARAKRRGFDVVVLPVNRFGQVEIESLRAALSPHSQPSKGASSEGGAPGAVPTIVSVVHGNNEIGSLNSLAEIAALCRERSALLHVDAAQSLGKIPIDVRTLGVDLLSASAHKIYGPKGAGFLFVRLTSPRVRLAPYLVGGGQEKGLRGGTHNVPAIVGFGAACALAQEEMPSESARLSELRDRLIASSLASANELGIEAFLNGSPADRLPNNISLTFKRLEPDEFLLAMSDVAYSSASACSSGDGGMSHVLAAIGHAEDPHSVTVRFGLGRFTTESDLERAQSALKAALLRARKT